MFMNIVHGISKKNYTALTCGLLDKLKKKHTKSFEEINKYPDTIIQIQTFLKTFYYA